MAKMWKKFICLIVLIMMFSAVNFRQIRFAYGQSIFVDTPHSVVVDTPHSVVVDTSQSVFADTPQSVFNDNKSKRIKVELTFDGASYTYVDNPIEPTNHLVADEFFCRKINGTYEEKREIMTRCVNMGGTFKTAVLYSMPLIEGVVDRAIAKSEREAEDSKISFNPDKEPMFVIKREREGRRFDEDEVYMQIYSALLYSPCVKVGLRAIPVLAQITAEDNVKLTNLRAKYSTSYERSGENRKHNIELALKKINGAVVEVDEIFSFNKRVGARSAKNGYKQSKIIINGRYEDGVGGGVCQVSTTLYNAVLLGGLNVISAQAHSLECSYELPSFDCMVNANSADLRFKNDGGGAVFIRAFSEGGRACVEVYGQKMDCVIKRKSEVIERKDAPKVEKFVDLERKYHGVEAVSGSERFVSYPHGQLRSVGYLEYYDFSGNLIRTQKIRSDVYKEQKGLIAVAP